MTIARPILSTALLWAQLISVSCSPIYVSQGSGIRQALLEASDGDTIFIPAGNFSGPDHCGLDVNVSKLTIEGMGKLTRIFCGGDDRLFFSKYALRTCYDLFEAAVS